MNPNPLSNTRSDGSSPGQIPAHGLSELRTPSPLDGQSPSGERLDQHVIVDRGRVRFDASISPSERGGTVTTLSVTALTPGHKTIAVWHLDPAPSGELGIKLAALLKEARDKNKPANAIVRSLAEHTQGISPCKFIRRDIAPASSAKLLMEREIPDFKTFAQNLSSIDRIFKTETIINNSPVKARAVMNPEKREVFIETFVQSSGENKFSKTADFRVRPKDGDAIPQTPQEQMQELHTLTAEVFHVLVTRGVGSARAEFMADVDGPLGEGRIDPIRCDVNTRLASGARILSEIGDTKACVRVENGSSSFTWIIDYAALWRAHKDYSFLESLYAQLDRPIDPNNRPKDYLPHTVIKKYQELTNILVEELVLGDASRCLSAVGLFARLNSKPDSKQPSNDERENLSSPDLFSGLKNIMTRMEPRGDLDVLDLLDDIQTIEVSLLDESHVTMTPHHPNKMRFGILPDGGLRIEVVTPFQNNTEVIVPASHLNRESVAAEFENKHLAFLERVKQPKEFGYMSAREGYEKAMLYFATLFNFHKKGLDIFHKIRKEIEALSAYSGGEVPIATRTKNPDLFLPSVENLAANRAYAKAAEVAKIHKLATGCYMSDIQILSEPENRWKVRVIHQSSPPSLEMSFQVSEEGLHAVTVNRPLHEPIVIDKPLSQSGSDMTINLNLSSHQETRYTFENPITIDAEGKIIRAISNHFYVYPEEDNLFEYLLRLQRKTRNGPTTG